MEAGKKNRIIKKCVYLMKLLLSMCDCDLVQLQVFQVWVPLCQRTAGVQVSALAQSDPGQTDLWSDCVWNLLELILWHFCKWTAEVSKE